MKDDVEVKTSSFFDSLYMQLGGLFVIMTSSFEPEERELLIIYQVSSGIRGGLVAM